jgi:hypothetical protein
MPAAATESEIRNRSVANGGPPQWVMVVINVLTVRLSPRFLRRSQQGAVGGTIKRIGPKSETSFSPKLLLGRRDRGGRDL